MKEEQSIKLDKKDKQIMRQLEENSRQSYTEIGKKVGLSNETIEYRIKKMLDNGLIIRMFAEPNLPRLGLKTYRIYLKTAKLTKEDEESILHYFATNPKAQWYAEFEGEWDYTLRLAVENETQLKEEMDRLMTKFGKFILAKDIVMTQYQTYLPISHFTESERKLRTIAIGKEKTIRIDEIDLKLLFHLFENARTKTVDLAVKVNLSPDAVQYRIKKLMEEGAIAFFTAWFDRRKFGYEYYKVLLWFQYATPEDERKLIAYCEQHPNIVFVNRVLGNWDLELDFDAKNSAEIHELVKEVKNRFPDMIRNHTTLAILKDGVPNPFG